MKNMPKSIAAGYAGLATVLTTLLMPENCRGEVFDSDNVRQIERNQIDSLASNAIAVEWKNATAIPAKAEKFDALVASVGGAALGRTWIYPGSSSWPLVDWEKVTTLKSFRDDQIQIVEESHGVAQSDTELACVLAAGWIIRNEGRNMAPWFEKWLLDTAKGTRANTKRLVLWSLSNVGEDMKRRAEEASTQAVVNWNQWLQSYQESDELGKAVILAAIMDLGINTGNYDTVKSIHSAVFAGNSDFLKAYALAFGGAKLGEGIKDAITALAANTNNQKLKGLANEALVAHAVIRD